MKVLLTAINAKYIHSNLAVYSLKAYAERNLTEKKKECTEIELAEYTILDFLMNRLVSSVLYYDTDSGQDSLDSRMAAFISDNYKTAYGQQSQGKSRTEKLYLRLLLVTDYVCGMTDSYAKRLYQEMNGII